MSESMDVESVLNRQALSDYYRQGRDPVYSITECRERILAYYRREVQWVKPEVLKRLREIQAGGVPIRRSERGINGYTYWKQDDTYGLRESGVLILYVADERGL